MHSEMWLWWSVIILSAMATATSQDPSEVTALQDLYRNLNLPPKLTGWRMVGGNPCDGSWAGLTCYHSSVVEIELRAMNLNGVLGHKLSSLSNLKQMDLSFNRIWGPIPEELPPNATHINLACNKLTNGIPSSLSNLKYLQYLNVSHNFLTGHVANVFSGLSNVREIDLSFNNFTGDLANSLILVKKDTREKNLTHIKFSNLWILSHFPFRSYSYRVFLGLAGLATVGFVFGLMAKGGANRANNPIVCTMCVEKPTFPSIRSLQNHKRACHGLESRCKRCDLALKNNSYLTHTCPARDGGEG